MFQYELSTMNIVQRSSMSQLENTSHHTDQLPEIHSVMELVLIAN